MKKLIIGAMCILAASSLFALGGNDSGSAAAQTIAAAKNMSHDDIVAKAKEEAALIRAENAKARAEAAKLRLEEAAKRKNQSTTDRLGRILVDSITRSVGREITRGVFGSIKKMLRG